MNIYIYIYIALAILLDTPTTCSTQRLRFSTTARVYSRSHDVTVRYSSRKVGFSTLDSTPLHFFSSFFSGFCRLRCARSPVHRPFLVGGDRGMAQGTGSTRSSGRGAVRRSGVWVSYGEAPLSLSLSGRSVRNAQGGCVRVVIRSSAQFLFFFPITTPPPIFLVRSARSTREDTSTAFRQ